MLRWKIPAREKSLPEWSDWESEILSPSIENHYVESELRSKISFLLILRLSQVALKEFFCFVICIFSEKKDDERLWNVNENASEEAVDGEKQTMFS